MPLELYIKIRKKIVKSYCKKKEIKFRENKYVNYCLPNVEELTAPTNEIIKSILGMAAASITIKKYVHFKKR